MEKEVIILNDFSDEVTLLKALSDEPTFIFGVETYDDSIQLGITLKVF